MMDGTAIDRLVAHTSVPKVESVNGKQRLITPSGWTDVTPQRPRVGPLELMTLTGLVTYLEKNKDSITQFLIHVAKTTEVHVRGVLEDEDTSYRRQTYLKAIIEESTFPFGSWMDAESFFISLQSKFVPTTERDQLLMFIASIRDSSVKETVDDGVGQEVRASRGVVLATQTKVPNPVTLKPYRTFREVDQPESPFILRVRPSAGDKPNLALFEGDGGAWRLRAIENVGAYLAAKLPTAIILA